MKLKVKFILGAIVILAALLRFYQISSNPPGLNSDEVAIGYNAYSILKTGADEYGQKFPLAFRSFDDYKPPLYVYLTVPSVAVFGLNEFAVRFPSAILGVAAVLLTFFLTKELLGNWVTALFASFLLAVSPWHIQFTRTAYETGSLAFFTCLGLLLFLKGQKKWPLLLLSAIVFGAETYLYQAARIFVPLFVGICLIIFSLPEIRQNLKKTIVFSCLFALVIAPNLYSMTTASGMLRFRGTSVFQDPKPADRLVTFRVTDWLRNDNRSVFLFHPEIGAYFQTVLSGYLSHFRPDFFLSNNSGPKIAYTPETGLMYLWELPFLLLGLHFLLGKRQKKPFFLLLGWLLLAPIPASVTTGVPSSVRTAVFLPALQILTSVGLIESLIILKRHSKKIVTPILAGFSLFVLWWLAFYLHMLFVHAPTAYSQNWYYGYKDVVLAVDKLAGKYEKIIVSTTLDEPHIFFLFFLKYDPTIYQRVDGGTISGGFAEDRNHFGKYYFKPVDWNKVRKIPKTLVVAKDGELPSHANFIKRFFNLDGSPSIVLAQTDDQ